ncbi:MAG: hypothetical protein AB7Y46_04635 [Armatimonadota bacterium]
MVSRFALLLRVLAATAAAAQPWQPAEFPIGFWLGPPVEANSLQTWQTVADCNFTFAGPAAATLSRRTCARSSSARRPPSGPWSWTGASVGR